MLWYSIRIIIKNRYLFPSKFCILIPFNYQVPYLIYSPEGSNCVRWNPIIQCFHLFYLLMWFWYMYTVYFVYRSSHGSVWNDVTGGHESSIHKLYVLILLCQTFTRDRRCSTTRGCLYSRWWGKRIQQEGEICGFQSWFYNQNTKICFFQMSKIHVICGSTQDDVHVGELLIREIQV